MNPKYIILEIQHFSDDSVAIPTPLYASGDWNQAESKFHQLCSVAAVSAVPKHTILFIEDNGTYHDSKCYEHAEQA